MFFLLFPYVLRACKHLQIPAPTPSCIFFLDIHLYPAPYSPYTCKKSHMSLHIYKYDAIEFIPFCS